MTACKNIIQEMLINGYATSPRLVEIAGYRYGARFWELRKKGFRFTWRFRWNEKGEKTNTTIYIMLTPKSMIDKKTLEIIQ